MSNFSNTTSSKLGRNDEQKMSSSASKVMIHPSIQQWWNSMFSTQTKDFFEFQKSLIEAVRRNQNQLSDNCLKQIPLFCSFNNDYKSVNFDFFNAFINTFCKDAENMNTNYSAKSLMSSAIQRCRELFFNKSNNLHLWYRGLETKDLGIKTFVAMDPQQGGPFLKFLIIFRANPDPYSKKTIQKGVFYTLTIKYGKMSYKDGSGETFEISDISNEFTSMADYDDDDDDDPFSIKTNYGCQDIDSTEHVMSKWIEYAIYGLNKNSNSSSSGMSGMSSILSDRNYNQQQQQHQQQQQPPPPPPPPPTTTTTNNQQQKTHSCCRHAD